MLSVETDPPDGPRLRGALAMVFNLPRYGFGLDLCPDAAPGDGLLDYVIFERPGPLRLAAYALAVLRGHHLRRPDVHHGRARRVRITCAEPVPMEIDGEAAGFAPVDIKVLPGALRVIDI